ncbi:acetate--CoA ligase family protein [Aliikangiella sp. G2MR2-5]|uniref:acetate--CoA ligase family protein n=1 Tax=Aliikangiella sp. G2MR2-5 TaxID=2788943 RepID=UPI0018A926BF|nr:acetate--CoA ligase family protein [Aliikangiella sp. G2MR2-5]
MAQSFVSENQVYQLLSRVELKTPKHIFIEKSDLIQNESAIKKAGFALNEEILLKGMADELWHKSDNGALKFTSYEPEKCQNIIDEMNSEVSKKFDWRGILMTEKVAFRKASNAPSEIFVSLQRDKCCGAVISLGFGGLLTEAWARELKQSLLVWPTSVYSPLEALEELEEHWLGKILLGKVRQEVALTSRAQLLEFLNKLWRLDLVMADEDISLIEINPFVVDGEGEFIALDGVGQKSSEPHIEPCPVPMQDDSFLNPRKIAIAGVSAKPGNVGGLILENVRQSKLSDDDLVIIKPGVDSLAGIRCIADITALKQDPVDILILALPAASSVDMIESLCEQGGGAEVVYIVAGGIGDGADQNRYGERLETLLNSRRKEKRWCPAIVGPNGLGMLLAPLRLNSLFIPQRKLNVNFDPESQVALISQSGAFLITRLSRHSNLSLKYGFSIGNQLDMKLSDFMALMARDRSIKVLGIYVEGFVEGDVCALAKLVKQFRSENRHVVIYKGGRSALGQAAAAGHTGAMTGDYHVQKRLLQKAGAVLVESFNQFNAVFKWMAAYPELHTLGKLAIVTNAGYETVGSVDILGDNDSGRLYELNQNNQNQLRKVLARHNLDGLAAPANPLDLTPMADEAAYFDCVQSMIEFGAGIVMLGLVPLSEQLDTHQLNQAEEFASKLKKLAEYSGRLIGVVIDAGVPYQAYKAVFEKQGFPVFDGMDMGVLGINVLKRSR